MKLLDLSGSCLCGEISYKAHADIKMIINCHCNDCQRATGSVHGTMVFIEEDKLELSGKPKQFEHPADSGNVLTKFFCGNCGSQVFGKNTGRVGMVGLRGGALDQKDLVTPTADLFMDSAIKSTPISPTTKHFPRMPI